jgi:hypothetical protein
LTTAVLAHSVGKELRALMATWTACAVMVMAPVLLPGDMPVSIALLAYGVGSLALGAQSMGQEYAHRTLGLLLSQPLSRRSLLLLKLGVLTVMLAALAAIAWMALASRVNNATEGEPAASGLTIIFLSALFVTPFLTMLTRSAVAGLVFSVALPGVLMTIINVVADVRFGAGAREEIALFRETAFWRAMIGITMTAAVGVWWMFMRLEAIEGRGQDLHLPRWLSWTAGAGSDAPMRRRHPMFELVRKELHLQQMALVVAGISAVLMGVAMLGRYVGSDVSQVFIPISMVYMAAMPFLIGSMASAEERQVGTREWQLLLPVAAGTQWRVKAGVAIALALVLGVGLPALMAWIWNIPGGFRVWPSAVITLVLLTSVSLYVSSLTTTGIRALLISVAVCAAGMILVSYLVVLAERLLRGWGMRRPLAAWWYSSEWVWFAGMSLAAGLISLLLLNFASMNHGSAERPRVQLRGQVGWIAATAVVFAVGLALLGVH